MPHRWLFLLTGTIIQYTANCQLLLQFDHRIGDKKLVLDPGTLPARPQDPLSISLLQYYISNIELTRSNGEKYTMPRTNSIFLLKESIDSSKTIALPVPEGSYTTVSFLIGVDSITSTLPIEARKGVLDPGQDMAASESMYWTWNSGYIFFKMEGSSPHIPADKTGFRQFEYHIGGYGGYNSPTINNLRRVTIALPANAPLRMANNRKAQLTIRFNALSVFEQLDLTQHHHIMLTPISSRIADNYAKGFTYAGLEYLNN